MLRLWLAMIVGALLVVGSGIVSSMARAQSSGDPAAVITAYEMARNRRDVDAALSYFAEDAIITQRSTTYSGKDEIRNYLEAVSTRSRFIVVSDRRVNGNHVSWTERSGSQSGTDQQQAAAVGQSQQVRPGLNVGGVQTRPGVSVVSFSINVEALVQDGKIRSVAYALPNQPARPDPSLEGRAQLPASVGLAAVGVVLAVLLLTASLGFRRRLGSPSSLQGRLLQDLQGWSAARQ